jgi:hypothetical protein
VDSNPGLFDLSRPVPEPSFALRTRSSSVTEAGPAAGRRRATPVRPRPRYASSGPLRSTSESGLSGWELCLARGFRAWGCFSPLSSSSEFARLIPHRIMFQKVRARRFLTFVSKFFVCIQIKNNIRCSLVYLVYYFILSDCRTWWSQNLAKLGTSIQR